MGRSIPRGNGANNRSSLADKSIQRMFLEGRGQDNCPAVDCEAGSSLLLKVAVSECCGLAFGFLPHG